MDTITTIGSPTLDATPRSRSFLQVAATGAVAATVANTVLWAGGRAAEVDYMVSLPTGDLTRVGIVEIVVTTLVMFAVGAAVLALAARRSHRWARAVTIVAGAFAVVSAGGPLSAALDAATGTLLAAMHLATGAAFVVTAGFYPKSR